MMNYLLLLLLFLLSTEQAATGNDDRHLTEKYKRWIEQEAVYIISDREKEIFYQLENDSQRDRFITEFWKQHDPSPGSKRNEFKEEHYRRIEYANKWLGREGSLPGWKTDRGRIYILFGEPKSKNAYYSHQKLMPMEIWFYQADPTRGVPSFFYTIFFKRFGVGELILYDPALHGPESLIYLNAGQSFKDAPNAIAQFDTELAMASVNLVPSEVSDWENYSGRAALSSIQLIDQIDNVSNYRRDPTWAENLLAGVERITTDFSFPGEGLETNYQIVKMPNGVPILNYVFHIPNRSLELGQYEDTFYAAIEATFSVVTADGKTIISDKISFDQNLNDLQRKELEAGGFCFENNEIVIPGSFDVTLTVRNLVSKKFFTYSENITIPYKQSDSLLILSPVLYSESFTGAPVSPGAIEPYKYDRMQYKPLLSGNVKSGNTLGVFYQIISPEDLKQKSNVQITYRLLSESGETAKEKTVWISPEQFDAFGVASLVWQFSTEELIVDNKYLLEIEAKQGEELYRTHTSSFVVSAKNPSLPGLMRRGKSLNLTGSDVFVKQATMLRSIGRDDIALRLLEGIKDQFPNDEECQKTLATLLIDSGESREAISVLERLLIRHPENIEMRKLIAKEYLRTTNFVKAIGHYERLLLEGGESTETLNLLGEAYLLNGNIEGARESWQRSLELNSKQERIRSKLNSL